MAFYLKIQTDKRISQENHYFYKKYHFEMDNVMLRQETIVAPATVQGQSAIAVVRMSGKETFKIIKKVFFPLKKIKFEDIKTHQLLFGVIKNQSGELVDEVLVSFFRNPHSYTGEDSVEISSHGSPYIQQRILELLIDCGATYANAGEFTMRAYANGKMDLAQAEAVTDIIAAQTEASHKIAMQQMRGRYSNTMKKLREDMLHFMALLELELDFSEEDVEFADRTQLLQLLNVVKTEINGLTDSFKMGQVIKNGVPVAIIGAPNVGKSTLLNALLNEEKAIVSDIPGTTRDVVEDSIVMNGISYRFIDTAGLRDASDEIEQLGIERSYEQAKKADIILYVVDASLLNVQTLKKNIDNLLSGIKKEVECIVIFNKSDKSDINLSDISLHENVKMVSISAKQKINLTALTDLLQQHVNTTSLNQQTVVSNARHYDALVKAKTAIISAEEGFALNVPTDLIAIDIRTAIYHIGAITGQVSSDEVLGHIFGNFCIGK